MALLNLLAVHSVFSTLCIYQHLANHAANAACSADTCFGITDKKAKLPHLLLARGQLDAGDAGLRVVRDHDGVVA